MADSLAMANAAMVNEEFEAAVDFYDRALTGSPRDAALYTARAQAHIQLENWLDAADDASKALQLDPCNAKAHFRKGVASFELEEYETAKTAFEEAAVLDPKLKAAKGWLAKCSTELSNVSEYSTSVRAAGPVEEKVNNSPVAAGGPNQSAARLPKPSAAEPGLTIAQVKHSEQQAPDLAAAMSAPTPPSALPEQVTKYRHQWLQTPTHVEVAVLAKRLTQERVSVSIGADALTVVVRDGGGAEEYRLDTPLYSAVITEGSRWELLGTKVEVRLQKAAPGSWPRLEAAGAQEAPNWSAATAPAPKVYPSSRHQVVDWNAMEAKLLKEEKEEELGGDAGTQRLFRTIYAGADEDTRRAMNKSYQESNGTVLSTSWADIGSKRTEFKAPEGALVKKFEF